MPLSLFGIDEQAHTKRTNKTKKIFFIHLMSIKKGTLYIVSTPIGNLDDISARAIKILESVSLIACEDTRQTQKIINRFDINNTIIFNKNENINSWSNRNNW